MDKMPPLLEERLRYHLKAKKHHLIYCSSNRREFYIFDRSVQRTIVAVYLHEFVVPLPDGAYVVRCAAYNNGIDEPLLIVAQWHNLDA